MNPTQHKALFERIQSNFPVAERPFAAIAEELGTSEAEVLAQLRAWSEEGLIRQLGPVFEPRRLGYQSALVACRIDPARLPALVERLAIMNGVTHVYERDHRFNLWFTLSVNADVQGPESRVQSLYDELQKIKNAFGGAEFHLLPATKVFKIKVQFGGGEI